MQTRILPITITIAAGCSLPITFKIIKKDIIRIKIINKAVIKMLFFLALLKFRLRILRVKIAKTNIKEMKVVR